MGSRIKGFYAKHPIISHLIILCITALLTGWAMMLFLDVWTRHGSTAKVPNVCNIDSHAAVRALEAAGFTAEINDSAYDQRYRPGQVISTWPRAGAIVKPGREIYLTIASYETQMVEVRMPLVNVSSRQALNYLEKQLKIKNVQIKNIPSQYPDLVINALYDGRSITPGMRLPVTAKVVLEVGVVPVVTDVDVESDSYNDDGSQPAPQSVTTTFEDDEDISTSAAYD